MADHDNQPSDIQPQDAVTASDSAESPDAAPVKKAAARKSVKKATVKKTTAKKTTAKKAAASDPQVVDPETPEASEASESSQVEAAAEVAPVKRTAAKKAATKKAAAKRPTTKKTATRSKAVEADESVSSPGTTAVDGEESDSTQPDSTPPGSAEAGMAVLFQVPEPQTPRKRSTAKRAAKKTAAASSDTASSDTVSDAAADAPSEEDVEGGAPASTLPAAADAPAAAEAQNKTHESDKADDSGDSGDHEDTGDHEDSGDDAGPRRRRRRGGRRRRKSSGESGGSDGAAEAGSETSSEAGADHASGESDDSESADEGDGSGGEGSSRRRRRRRRDGDSGASAHGSSSSGNSDPAGSTSRSRRSRNPEDEITAVAGSTRLEAKKQRRREGREAGRRRAPIVSEAEFLARRESVERVMAVRQRGDVTQIGVIEDKVLVEHYVARESQTSMIGNIYLGRVQNVLPSMEAAFIDIGKGRNAVLYAGEVNWSALGHKDGQARKIESVLSSGQTVLVQVSKDPIGHKGARLTSQISLAGRFLVYVPDGTTSGISRKLPDTERHRLKTLLKEIVPDTAGVIVRTAAEGASEAELTSDVERLKARWEQIEATTKASAPQLLYGEPDLTLKVVRDLFTEDFAKLVVQGQEAWNLVSDYVDEVAPDLAARLERYEAADHGGVDLFSTYRLDEQIAKGLDRKVWLPSGGSLVIDRTEAMTVVDVNTGKFTGSGGNLEETVTKNNLEAAEEIVRQLRLRDIGGIIVVDFIDMVLESNRDLVLRRLVECLGRDRTRHQVAEVTSLGLVQMTRKRIGTGLLEAFSETCEHCAGRGAVLHDVPVEAKRSADDDGRRSGGGRRRGRGRDDNDDSAGASANSGNGDRRGSGSGSNGRGRSTDTAPSAPSSGGRRPSPSDFAAMASQPDDNGAAEQIGGDSLVETAADASPDAVVEPTVQTPAEVTEEVADASPTTATTSATPVVAAPVVDAPVAEPVAAKVPGTTSVVTTTRRRGASRGAVTAGTAASLSASDVAPPPSAAPATTSAPPKVVTRTRGTRRAATTAPEPTADTTAD